MVAGTVFIIIFLVACFIRLGGIKEDIRMLSYLIGRIEEKVTKLELLQMTTRKK